MSEKLHTPTPYKQNGNRIHKGIHCVAIASTTPMSTDMEGKGYEMACANAAFIITACNSHDALCRALGEIATGAAYVAGCKQCPKKMKPGMQAIVDAAVNALAAGGVKE